jgi:hypothetical protein
MSGQTASASSQHLGGWDSGMVADDTLGDDAVPYVGSEPQSYNADGRPSFFVIA